MSSDRSAGSHAEPRGCGGFSCSSGPAGSDHSKCNDVKPAAGLSCRSTRTPGFCLVLVWVGFSAGFDDFMSHLGDEKKLQVGPTAGHGSGVMMIWAGPRSGLLWGDICSVNMKSKEQV